MRCESLWRGWGVLPRLRLQLRPTEERRSFWKISLRGVRGRPRRGQIEAVEVSPSKSFPRRRRRINCVWPFRLFSFSKSTHDVERDFSVALGRLDRLAANRRRLVRFQQSRWVKKKKGKTVYSWPKLLSNQSPRQSVYRVLPFYRLASFPFPLFAVNTLALTRRRSWMFHSSPRGLRIHRRTRRVMEPAGRQGKGKPTRLTTATAPIKYLSWLGLKGAKAF